MISTEDDKAIPPPSHPLQVPIIDEMVQEARPGLTESVVTDPGRVILFFGW